MGDDASFVAVVAAAAAADTSPDGVARFGIETVPFLVRTGVVRMAFNVCAMSASSGAACDGGCDGFAVAVVVAVAACRLLRGLGGRAEVAATVVLVAKFDDDGDDAVAPAPSSIKSSSPISGGAAMEKIPVPASLASLNSRCSGETSSSPSLLIGSLASSISMTRFVFHPRLADLMGVPRNPSGRPNPLLADFEKESLGEMCWLLSDSRLDAAGFVASEARLGSRRCSC
mmetsp:Transcript_11643/g.33538  ORF Transcript_11643/g.33538 Transcript_11643/m.33538 type:complete len:229 (-) Transcript_11643:240-926(-)